jgi:hypothetical protein
MWMSRRSPPHNDVERYAWIVDPSGNEIMQGLDCTARDGSGRLHRIATFHGALPPLDLSGAPAARSGGQSPREELESA